MENNRRMENINGYVVYETPFWVEGTDENNYNAFIQDAFKIQKFIGFTFDEAVDFVRNTFEGR